MKSYEINEDTLVILPIDKKKTKVLEKDYEFVVEKNPYEIMDASCQYFGSTYEGRKGGSQNILGSSYKVPIIVKEENYIIFFPTESPALDSCIWISLHNIQKIEKGENHTTNLYFKEGKKMNVPVSYRSIENQILRSTRLESVLRNRTTDQKNIYFMK